MAAAGPKGVGDSSSKPIDQQNQAIQSPQDLFRQHIFSSMQATRLDLAAPQMLSQNPSQQAMLRNPPAQQQPGTSIVEEHQAQPLVEQEMESYDTELQAMGVSLLSQVDKSHPAAQKLLEKACKNNDFNGITDLTKAGVVPSKQLERQYSAVLGAAGVNDLMHSIIAMIHKY